MSADGTITTLFSFNGTNGCDPTGALLQAGDGSLYGTTYTGGSGFVGGQITSPLTGFGTVFRVTTNGAYSPLVLFNGTNGAHPSAGLTLGADGNFYGTASAGDTNGGTNGTIFQLTAGGSFTTLFMFNGTNGSGPYSPLLSARDGCLYGTTYRGGISNLGSIFKISTNGTFTEMVSFTNAGNGSIVAGLMQATDGNFYGTASASIFQMTTNGALTTQCGLNSAIGLTPGGLIQATDGNFYGMTQEFGIYSGHIGQGAVFQVGLPLAPVFQGVKSSNATLSYTWSAVAGQKYQVQYVSELASTNWLNLGGAITATNGSITSSDSLGAASQRFYRVILSQ